MDKEDEPRRPKSAYAYFMPTYREKYYKEYPDEDFDLGNFSAMCAERWRTMSDEERRPFHKKADKDKERFDTEMAVCEPPKEVKSKSGGSRNPGAPKRPMSAFFWYCKDKRKSVRNLIPKSTLDDVSKVLTHLWHDQDDETRSKYEARAARDLARYQRELKAYKGKKSKRAPPPKKMGR